MIYLLDTDTCIHLMRGRPKVVERASQAAPDDLALAAITHYELRFGALRCAPEHRARELSKVEHLLATLHAVPFSKETARFAAEIRAELESRGQPIGPMDTLIAACGLENGLTLVTGNLREFVKVPGLMCETWS